MNIWKTYGCFLKWWYPQNTPKWSFLVGKPMVVGYPHLRKPPYLNPTRPISRSRFQRRQHFGPLRKLANQTFVKDVDTAEKQVRLPHTGKDHKVGSWYFNQLGGSHCWDPIWIYPHYDIIILLMEEIRLTSWYGKYPNFYRVLYIRWCRISTINSITGWFQRFYFVIIYPYLGKRSNLDDFFQLVWNQHLVQRFMFMDVFFSGVTILFCNPCYEFLVGLA